MIKVTARYFNETEQTNISNSILLNQKWCLIENQCKTLKKMIPAFVKRISVAHNKEHGLKSTLGIKESDTVQFTLPKLMRKGAGISQIINNCPDPK